MHDTTPTPPGATVLQEWITGNTDTCDRVFFVEHGVALAELGRVATARDAMLVPIDSGDAQWPAIAIAYSGALRESGDDLFVGDLHVELQDYVAASFVEILAPTIVRFRDVHGWRAFIEDADLARSTGVFPPAVIDPRLQIADRQALVAPFLVEPPTSLHLHADGRMTFGAQGIDLGEVRGLSAALATPRPRIAALGAVAPMEVLVSDVGARPWLERYLRAGDLMRTLGLRSGQDLIGGFGRALVQDDAQEAEPRGTDPFLVVSPQEVILADLTTLRRQRLTPESAAVVEVVQTSRTVERAARRVARHLGLSRPDALSLCRQAIDELGVRCGRSVGAETAPHLSVVAS
ncbi:MAG: daptide biosynthesis RiPP recognition protein [Actinomycetota bacterium]